MNFNRTLHTNRRNRRWRELVPFIAVGTLILLGIIGTFGLSAVRAGAVTEYADCTITEREDRALASLDKRAPRIYTDCGVFVVEDEVFRLHFTAADVYAQMEPGKTLDFTAVGWRVGLLSWFPNVVEVN